MKIKLIDTHKTFRTAPGTLSNNVSNCYFLAVAVDRALTDLSVGVTQVQHLRGSKESTPRTETYVFSFTGAPLGREWISSNQLPNPVPLSLDANPHSTSKL